MGSLIELLVRDILQLAVHGDGYCACIAPVMTSISCWMHGGHSVLLRQPTADHRVSQLELHQTNSGLDTVRYCDGTGVSSICQTYRVLDTCQNIPNLGYICCCSDQLCNSAIKPSSIGMLAGLAVLLVMGVTTLMASHF
uniref:Uncharacterized protein n=1 Tax=Ditylenchus dipsaci TaxID=166011 RepID=A0A915DIL3_9BILA